MRTHLLCAAAMAVAASTAAPAFDLPARSFSAESGGNVRIHREGGGREWRDGDQRRSDRDHGSGYGYGYGYYEPGQWARYNNRSWEADGFNDWWHSQSNRSLPRWTQENRRSCRQQYWTSSGWTC